MKTRTATCLIVSFLLVLALRADPIGVQADARGTLRYPTPEQGNETALAFLDSSGALSGDSHATAGVNETRSGTDVSAGPGNIGTSGTTTVSAAADASLGHLAASGEVSASSHSNGGSMVFFAHGGGDTSSQGAGTSAFFADITTVYNSNYALGTSIPVELTMFLDWHGGWDLGTTGFNSAFSQASALLAIADVGNDTIYDRIQSDADPSHWVYAAPLTFNFNVANGNSFYWLTYMTLITGVSLGGGYSDGPDSPHIFPEVAASAFGNATIDITPTSDLAGTLFTSESGHVYGGDTTPAVPDATSTIILLGFGLGALSLASRLRHSRFRNSVG